MCNYRFDLFCNLLAFEQKRFIEPKISNRKGSYSSRFHVKSKNHRLFTLRILDYLSYQTNFVKPRICEKMLIIRRDFFLDIIKYLVSFFFFHVATNNKTYFYPFLSMTSYHIYIYNVFTIISFHFEDKHYFSVSQKNSKIMLRSISFALFVVLSLMKGVSAEYCPYNTYSSYYCYRKSDTI